MAWKYLFPVILFLNLSGLVIAFANPWRFEVPTTATGSFTANDPTGKGKVAGDFSRLPNGFIKVTVNESSGAGAARKGTVRYSLEVPQFGLFSQPLFSESTAMVTTTGSAPCPTTHWDGVFAFSAWASQNDVSKQDQAATGTFSWDPQTKVATVEELFNLTDSQRLPNFKPFTVPGTCQDGKITLNGEGDRGGVLHMTSNQGGVFYANTGKVMILLPKQRIDSTKSLEGTFSALNYESGAVTEPQMLALTVAKGQGRGSRISNMESGKSDTKPTWVLSNITLNTPAAGLFTAKLKHDKGVSRNATCAAHLGDSTFVFCTAQAPGDSRRPFNFVMTQNAPMVARAGK